MGRVVRDVGLYGEPVREERAVEGGVAKSEADVGC